MENARRYVPPDRDTVWERDWKDQHAIFTIENGKIIFDNDHEVTTMEELVTRTRCDIFKSFMEEHVLSREMSCRIPFDICTRDVVPEEDVHSVLGATISVHDTLNIPIPDFSTMAPTRDFQWGEDVQPVEHKVNKLYFIGPCTSAERLDVFEWSKGHPWMDVNLTAPVEYSFANYIDLAEEAYSPYIPKKYQTMFRHQACIDGESASWERLPWIMQSKCVMWKHKSELACWYTPLLEPWRHYVPFTLHTLEAKWRLVKDNTTLAQKIVHESNHFANKYLTTEAHAKYTRELFQNIIELKDA